jgi:peptidoglycan-N-acetylglucosamine deacetylase
MKISILIPCYNEEKTIAHSLDACLAQTRPADEIVVVNDGSTDSTMSVLLKYKDRIKIVDLPKNTGNKSRAQEAGLRHVTGEVFIATDADTILDKDFVKHISREFSDEKVVAAAGYVKSMRGNWLTAVRELEYFYGQELNTKAQSNINSLFVIPGCASAFRSKLFKVFIDFEHDTLTEDLDFTYKIHQLNMKIAFCPKAVVYTQDPDNLSSYMNQLRRWYVGAWQNLLKHWKNVRRPGRIMEVFFGYGEKSIFSVMIFVMPFININYFKTLVITVLLFSLVVSSIAGVKRKRWDLLIYSPLYIFIMYINAYVFMETFVKEIILKQNKLSWYKPERRAFA